MVLLALGVDLSLDLKPVLLRSFSSLSRGGDLSGVVVGNSMLALRCVFQ